VGRRIDTGLLTVYCFSRQNRAAMFFARSRTAHPWSRAADSGSCSERRTARVPPRRRTGTIARWWVVGDAIFQPVRRPQGPRRRGHWRASSDD